MAAPWVLLVIFMAMICVGESEGEGPKTVSRLSSALLNSSGWKPNDNTYLVSSDGTFCAGFYNVTPNRYAFAVWYANDSDRTLAWMANLTSLVGANSSLTLQNAALSISDEHGAIVWRSKVTPNSKYAMDLILQDAGNMVFNQWESFKDFPTFNLLPTQDFTAGDVLQSRLANGTYGRDGNYYSLSLQKETSKLSLFYYRNKEEGREPKWYWQSEDSFPIATMTDSGYLNTSIISTGTPIMASDRGKMGILRRLTLNRDGNLRMYSRKRNPPSSSWVVVWEAILAHCKIHGACGENAVCKVNSAWKPICQCPPGFDPSPVDNRSCKPHNDIKELTNVTFVTLDYVNFEGWNSTQVQPTILQDCIDFCRTNTSCVGFAYNLDNGNCVYQFGKLINGYWSPEAHTRMYLKISASSEEAPNLFQGMLSVLENVCPMLVKISSPNDSDHTTEYIIIIWSFAGAELLCGVYFFYAFLRKYSKFRDMDRLLMSGILPSGGPKQFSYAELKAATNNFSNKLGEGGFGPVYRGVLGDQRQIAVKKLEGLHHGEKQFWAEVSIIGRIHHLNLVRMWGFCAEGEHRLLVYEYIPNGSLEKHLFKTEGATVMEWGVRYRIALGVARAIAYLHEECLEWVLHCDIKPENILVDANFCPKVSDFGLAKLVEKDCSLNVSKIRGTRGYLAPEWFQSNLITAKVDVYSFGMVLFEMVSGKRNLTDNEFYFPEWAFQKVVVEGKPEEVVDKRLNGIRENRSEMEAVRRVVKTALWCSQSRAEERPSMGKVAKMLDGSIEIEDPPKPSLFEDAGGSLQSLFQDTGGGSQLPSYSGMNTSITRSGLSRF
ncbi:G-type lectin S-receptor-like serine/threonine-protein kinase At1g34300 [Cryptomeria japonica]|uniref:G-type lectin S-receptor-like serine/threonine-protein kinase At1g34300 n=1 Tax=Cryptomeria japonica TaxID=3369 RepID=UPI0027DA2CCD|nr:G-type lectin S-receptor-like serine/threonine-protein kinase At1g34300 [Cryptomeria japonica]